LFLALGEITSIKEVTFPFPGKALILYMADGTLRRNLLMSSTFPGIPNWTDGFLLSKRFYAAGTPDEKLDPE
jgi:hypothetical protein